MGKKVRRLYRQFQPTNYTLDMQFDVDAMTFAGSVAIDGQKVDRPSERLTFHQNNLKITSAEIIFHDKRGDHTIPVKRINNQKTFDEVRLHADQILYPGKYTVKMNFEGTITRPMNGIYPCFFEHDNIQKKLIATQFESHHAREAFPCIDEPDAKATFELSLITPAGGTVIANTPVKAVKEYASKDGGYLASNAKPGSSTPLYTQTTFEPTPKMSTYLLAWVFGDMKYLEAKTKEGVVVRTYATPDNIEYTRFALDVAVKTLEFYNNYFDIPYPLPKCDMVALPDFASGAMENWGCITFREQTLLVDPKNTSLGMKQYVAMVVGHELAHMWFGNLVTMRWWNDLWLNESFASWVEYLATDHLFPEWHMWTQFAVDEQQPAFRLDALDNTHPIEVTINHPDEIRTIFDTISYSKGASILQMLYTYIGADNFRDGLRLYLRENAYGNTEGADLWDALGRISGKPVKSFMHAWVSQAGFPVLHATIDDEKVELQQERFYTNRANIKDAKKDLDTVWPIPLLPSQDLPAELLKTQSDQFKLKAAHQHLQFNSGLSGFYHTLYNPSHLYRLGECVKAGRMAQLDRLALLSDAFESAKAGYMSSVDAVKLLEFYVNEDSTVVWDIIAGGVGNIRTVMDDDKLREDLKPFIRKLVAKQLERLGWQAQQNEPYFDSLLRPTILGMASVGEEPSVVLESRRLFDAMQNPEDIHPDLRGVVYGTIARTGDAKDFDRMLAMHNASSSSEERLTLTGAITGFKQAPLIERALAMISSDEVRLQDAAYWLAYSFGNRYARDMAWDWMTANWQWLDDNMGKDLSFHRMPNYAARSFSDPAFLPKFKAFFGPMEKLPSFERPIKQALETLEWQSAWRKRDLTAIKAFFKA
jgi:puromycin-sensitive aminopeptidase